MWTCACGRENPDYTVTCLACRTRRPETSRLGVVGRNRDFRLLFLAAAGSSIGTYLAALALTAHIYDLTGSGVWVAALLIADFLPIIVIGLTMGPLVDRLSRRRLMVVSDLVRFGVFLALPFVDSAIGLVVMAGVAGIATGFFRPAAYAGLPNLVGDEDELVAANSLLTAVENAAWMIGPVIAGVLLAVWSPDVAYVANAVTFLLSALLVAGIPAARLQSDDPLTRGYWRDVRDGISFVVGEPALRMVLIVWSLVMFASAAVNVAEVAYAKDALEAGDVGFGLLVGASGLGLTVGSLLVPLVLGQIGMRRLYWSAIALMGVSFALAGAVAPTIWVGVALVALAAAGNAGALVCNQLLIQRGAPDQIRGRAISVIMSFTYVALGLGMVVAGPLTDAIGPRALWTAAGAMMLVTSVVAFALMRSLATLRAEVPLPEPERATV